MKIKTLINLLVILLIINNCSILNKNENTNDSSKMLTDIALRAQSNVNYTLNSETGCIDGVTTSMDTSLPSWIKDNFKCVTVKVSGSNYVFTATNLPNHKSFYYGYGNSLYEDLPSGNTPAGINRISAQSITITVPSSPTVSGSSETPLGTIGVSTNGVAIFSNDAGPGDTLSKEAGTFDTYAGHPQQQGVYHYHAEPIYLTSTNTANLIGVSLDGYAIYGTKCDNGTSDTSDDYSPASPSSSPTGTGLDSNHGHTTTTTHFSTATYHYHVGLDSTAGITTIFGDYFHGAPGSAR